MMDRERTHTSSTNDSASAERGVARRFKQFWSNSGLLQGAGALAFAVAALAASEAAAATVYVANTGSDSISCGGESSPCRTISQAVQMAAAGDRVLVGPGVYGDVDGDGEFITPGDEPASYDTGCHCLVYVDKPVTILSQAGAGATILRGAVDGLYAVALEAPGAAFGKKKAGFSVVGDLQHDGHGVWLGRSASGARVEGNTFSRLESGIYAAGNGARVSGNRISQVLGRGIQAEGESIVVAANTVEETGTLGAADAAIHAIGLAGGGNRIERNLVIANHGIGIYADNGRSAAAGAPAITGNLVVGNTLTGIKVVLAARSGTVAVTGNSIYGNDHLRGTNCGLTTLVDGPIVDATNNFWGAPVGPGADPMDDVCSAGTPPNVGAAASTEFSIVAPAMR